MPIRIDLDTDPHTFTHVGHDEIGVHLKSVGYKQNDPKVGFELENSYSKLTGSKLQGMPK
jgi:hypothetical protein